MDHKELVTRFTKACYRFEAMQEDLDILLFDTEDEIKANEYEDLADQAAEIILRLSANGNNVGMHFYNYYLCRLEYIIAYFRELLDDEETPLAEDKQDEVDNENDAQAVESDEGAPISEDPPLDRKTKRDLEEYKGWFELSENEQQCVLDTLAVYLGLPSAIHEFVCATKRLQTDISTFCPVTGILPNLVLFVITKVFYAAEFGRLSTEWRISATPKCTTLS